jgi:hypothetical protein
MLASAGPVARELGAKSIASCAGLREERLRVQLTLQQRLLRFLQREEQGEQRQHRELRSQPVSARVLEGECIEAARYLGEREGGHWFAVPDNTSKFRPGDTLVVGDGLAIEDGAPLVCGAYDARQGLLRLERDPFARGVPVQLQRDADYVIDRRPLGLQGRLRDAVRAAFEWPLLRGVLDRARTDWRRDDSRHERAAALLRELGLNDAQVVAGAAAIATESLALVQGPPGTGKTRLLAEVVALLAARGSRIALCAFTHKAVDNALLAIRRCAPDLPLFKLDSSSSDSRELLRAHGVQLVDARRAKVPDKGAVVGSTCYQIAKLADREQFHFTVFDEAGQLPIPHALPGMLRAQRWLFFGDHRQLPPVVTTAARRCGRGDVGLRTAAPPLRFAPARHHLSDERRGLPVVSETFYDGRLHPEADGRRAPAAVRARRAVRRGAGSGATGGVAAHRPPTAGPALAEEANAVAELVEELVRRMACRRPRSP